MEVESTTVAVKSLSPVVTIQETTGEADSDSSVGQRTPEPGGFSLDRVSGPGAKESGSPPLDGVSRPEAQESGSLRGKVRPGTGRRSGSPRLDGDRPDTRESRSALGGVGKERQGAESPLDADRPAAIESRSPQHGASDGSGGVGEEQQSSPAREAEYGSPTRPKPPRIHFEKPSSQRMAELDRHVLTVSVNLLPLFLACQLTCVRNRHVSLL